MEDKVDENWNMKKLKLCFLLIHTFPSLDAISVFNMTKQSQVDAEIHMLKVLHFKTWGIGILPINCRQISRL